jgi:hypothetical protein
MRKRLLLATTFGTLGLASSFALADRFAITSIQAMIFGAAAGAFVGYVLGVLFDVFLAPPPAETE